MDFKNNRRHYRAKYFAITKAYKYPKDKSDKASAEQIEITILNLSIDGAGILTKSQIETGAIVTLVIYLGGLGHEIMAYATFCKQIGEMYRVGLKLVSPDNLFTSMLLDYIKQEKES